MSSHAARQRTYKARQRNGLIVLSIVIDEERLVSALLQARLLDVVTDDRSRIEQATEKFLNEILETP